MKLGSLETTARAPVAPQRARGSAAVSPDIGPSTPTDDAPHRSQ